MIDDMIEELKELMWQSEKDMGLSDTAEEANYYGGESNAYEKSITIAEKYKAQEPRWIPVEERLPDEDDRYLVIISHPFVKPFPAVAYYTTDAYTLDEHYFAKYKNEKKKIFFAFSENEGFVEAEDVIAWMPIPEYAKGDME